VATGGAAGAAGTEASAGVAGAAGEGAFTGIAVDAPGPAPLTGTATAGRAASSGNLDGFAKGPLFTAGRGAGEATTPLVAAAGEAAGEVVGAAAGACVGAAGVAVAGPGAVGVAPAPGPGFQDGFGNTPVSGTEPGAGVAFPF
jgi:hypothetical protein